MNTTAHPTAQQIVQLELLNFLGDLVWIREEKRGQRVILGRIGVLGGVGGNGKYGVESREECKCSCGIPHPILAGRGYENFT